MHARLILRIALVVLILAAAAGPARAQDTSAAEKVATEWLALIDGGRYAESWTNAATTFRQAVTQEKWNEAARMVREPLGALKTRALKQASPAKNPPGGPPGDYVVFQFDTNFEHKAGAAETVSTVLDTDGSWHVVGYFVR